MTPPQAVLTVLQFAFIAVVFVWVSGQVRKPSGLLGRRLLRAMNLTHAAMTDWGLGLIPIAPDAAVLDIGCGGGRTLQRLAAIVPRGRIVGVDSSPASVAASRALNAADVETGRMRIERASVASLPFPDAAFDVVTAVETHYYWPDLPNSLREVRRVLKPGGRFVLIAETHRDGVGGALYALPMFLLRARFLSDAQHRSMLSNAGFVDVATAHHEGRNWIGATCRRGGD